MLTAPFTYFGGKRRVAAEVWTRFGDVGLYIEPFFGSGAVLLGRPTDGKTELVNDIYGHIVNFWRSVRNNPDLVARETFRIPAETELLAAHDLLKAEREPIAAKLRDDINWYDARIAGIWCFGQCVWFGAGLGTDSNANAKIPNLGGVTAGRSLEEITDRMRKLSARLWKVVIHCGDWKRCLSDAVLSGGNKTGIFLDPPYAADRAKCYAVDSFDVSHDVRAWAVEHGQDPRLRIAICGYEGEHQLPGWDCWKWKAAGGMGAARNPDYKNDEMERIWFSPHCRQPIKQTVFSFG